MRLFKELYKIGSRAGLRQFTTVSGGTSSSTQTSKAMISVPPWGLVGLGTAAAGFFGKVLHDDNLETRRELQATRSELQATRRKHKEDLKSVENGLKEDIKLVGNKVDSVNAKINEISTHLARLTQ